MEKYTLITPAGPVDVKARKEIHMLVAAINDAADGVPEALEFLKDARAGEYVRALVDLVRHTGEYVELLDIA